MGRARRRLRAGLGGGEGARGGPAAARAGAAALDEKKATLLEMARIYDGQLHDPGEAISALKRVLELDGADDAAIDALASLYRREARWGDLAGILARARDLAQDDATRG